MAALGRSDKRRGNLLREPETLVGSEKTDSRRMCFLSMNNQHQGLSVSTADGLR